ncbi:MAG: hypothetical protein ACLQGV_12615 [Bryobacteraceae bacterium]
MAERKVRVNVPTVGFVDGTPVQVLESTERWTDIKLEDGSVLRLKPVVMSVVRVEGRYDNDGNPMYAIQAGHVMTANAPDNLRQVRDEQRVKGVQ